LSAPPAAPTLVDMLQLRLGPSVRSRISDPVRQQSADPVIHRCGPLPRRVAERVRASAAALAALLEVEGRSTASLDDLEWADAVAARLVARQDASGRCACVCGQPCAPGRLHGAVRLRRFASGSSTQAV